jgi:phospholipid N-methyltransferase
VKPFCTAVEAPLIDRFSFAQEHLDLLSPMISSLQRYCDTYIRKWGTVGAIAPSSPVLARSITEHVAPEDTVLELGAGSGAFTRVLAQTVPDDQLHVVEVDPARERGLRAYTPNVYVTNVRDFLDRPRIDLSGAKVISGLPLLNFSKAFRRTVWQELLLVEDVASIRQFTYAPQSLFAQRWLNAHHVTARRTDVVVMNLPPAFVWEYTHDCDASVSEGDRSGRSSGRRATAAHGGEASSPQRRPQRT